MAKRTIPPEQRSAQEKFPYFRKLKVRTSYYDRPYTNLRTKYPEIIKIPWIQLRGHWLKRAGFTLDTPLDVKIQKGRITLTIRPSPD